MLEQSLLFTGCSSIKFFHEFFCDLWDTMQSLRSLFSSHFLSLRGHHATPGVTTLISYNSCDLQDTMPRQRSPLSFHAQSILRGAEDFPRGGKYSKDLPLPTSLASLQSV